MKVTLRVPRKERSRPKGGFHRSHSVIKFTALRTCKGGEGKTRGRRLGATPGAASCRNELPPKSRLRRVRFSPDTLKILKASPDSPSAPWTGQIRCRTMWCLLCPLGVEHSNFCTSVSHFSATFHQTIVFLAPKNQAWSSCSCAYSVSHQRRLEWHCPVCFLCSTHGSR